MRSGLGRNQPAAPALFNEPHFGESLFSAEPSAIERAVYRRRYRLAEAARALRALYGEWSASQHGGSTEFERFRTAAGATLRETAIYEALNAYFKERNAAAYGWMQWPAEFANPNSGAV